MDDYDAVQRFVKKHRESTQETFIPLDHAAGQRIEADFGQIAVDFPDGRRKVKAVVTRNNSALMVKNGTQGEVVGINTARNEIQLRIDGGMTIRLNVELFPHIDLGYCTTTHKAQGQTVESAFILVGVPMTDRELSYVQGSRAKGKTRFYADKVNGGSSIQQLAEQMAKSRAKDLIHDYLIEAA